METSIPLYKSHLPEMSKAGAGQEESLLRFTIQALLRFCLRDIACPISFDPSFHCSLTYVLYASSLVPCLKGNWFGYKIRCLKAAQRTNQETIVSWCEIS